MVASFPSAMRAYTVVRPNPTTRQNSFTRYANGSFGRTVSRAARLVAVMAFLFGSWVCPVPLGARIIRAEGASEFHRKVQRLQSPRFGLLTRETQKRPRANRFGRANIEARS